MQFTIKPAVRQEKKARIALDGPSGSGKTWTALAFGSALGSRTVVIDTERGSATLYAGTGPGEFAFDHLDMPSYEPDTLIAALHQCAAAGYDVVIVDSLTHFWSGVGGVLEQVDHVARRKTSGNSFAAWKDVRPMERRLLDAFTAYPGHVIVTMRTKTEWVIVENDRGRKEPKKIGMKPEQREGIEYEFDLAGSLDIDHTFVVTKSRCPLLTDAVVPKPDGRVAATLRDWLASGAPGAPAPAMPPPGGWFSDEYRSNGTAAPNGNAAAPPQPPPNGHPNGNGHHPDGATSAGGNGHAPPQQAPPVPSGRDRARLDWLARMRSQIAAATAEDALAALWPVVVMARDEGTIAPLDGETMKAEIRSRRDQLTAPVGKDAPALRDLHIQLTSAGVGDKGERKSLVWYWIGRDAGSTGNLTGAELAAVSVRLGEAIRGGTLAAEREAASARTSEPEPGTAGSQFVDPAEVPA